MRALLVAPQPMYEDRGTPIALRQVLQALAELGHDVDVLTYPLGRSLALPGVSWYRTSNRSASVTFRSAPHVAKWRSTLFYPCAVAARPAGAIRLDTRGRGVGFPGGARRPPAWHPTPVTHGVQPAGPAIEAPVLPVPGTGAAATVRTLAAAPGRPRCREQRPEVARYANRASYTVSRMGLPERGALRRCYRQRGRMLGAVLFRTGAVRDAGGFQSGRAMAEDYELLPRVARAHPMERHDAVVAEYRRYPSSASSNADLVLAGVLDVLARERAVAPASPQAGADAHAVDRAFDDGERFFRLFYGVRLTRQIVREGLLRGRFRRAGEWAGQLVRQLGPETAFVSLPPAAVLAPSTF